MKTIRTSLLFAGLYFCAITASAQNEKLPINEPDYSKPRLFDGLPSRIQVSTEELQSLINAPAGYNTSQKSAGPYELPFEGDVVSVASKYDNQIQSTVLRSTNFNGASFTVSRIQKDDGTVEYKGRVISFKHADLFELMKEGDQYVLVKKNYYELVNE